MQQRDLTPTRLLDPNTIVRLPAAQNHQLARFVSLFDDKASFKVPGIEQLVRINPNELVEVLCLASEQTDVVLEFLLAQASPFALPDTLAGALPALDGQAGAITVDASTLAELLRHAQQRQSALHVMALHVADLLRDANLATRELMQSELMGDSVAEQARVVAETTAIECQHQALTERLRSIMTSTATDDDVFGPWWPGDDPTHFTVLGIVDGYQYVLQHTDATKGQPAVLRRTACGRLRRFMPATLWPSTREAQSLATFV